MRPYVCHETRLGAALLVPVALAAADGDWVLRPSLPAAERGRRLAERAGCFACHGPEGTRGTANPGRKDRTVPDFASDGMMYADDPGDIREWIEDGSTAKRRQSRTWLGERKQGALRRLAFGRRLSARQIDDLAAFGRAGAGDPEPEDTADHRGLERAEALGCVGCHGPGGRFARPNPGSLKGFVPSRDGRDFPDLERGREEFSEWVEEGVSRRLRANVLARYFLRRATLKMPAYRRHLAPGDVATWAYVSWLRSAAAR